MNRNVLKIVTVIGIALLLTGCDSKLESHFKDGGNLLCADRNLFSKDTIRTVNGGNADLSTKHGAHGSQKTIVTLRGGSMFNHTSFDIDDCEIK